MSLMRSLVARAIAVLVVVVVVAMAGPLFSAGSTAVDIPTPAVSLDPTSGPVGTQVEAVATGFEACPATVNESPTIVFTFDGVDELSRVPTKGEGATSFVVAETVEPGIHQVVARCLAAESVASAATFEVTAPPEGPVIVPDVVALSLDDARVVLEDAGLSAFVTSGDGPLVESQDPAAGTPVPTKTIVGITLEDGASAALVVVPNVVGGRLDQARPSVALAGLALGGVSGNGDVVVEQVPTAGSQVPAGTTVDVVLGASPPPLARVPDLVGESVEDGVVLLAAAGLVLANDAEGADTVESQSPAAGSVVPVGTAVTVVAAEPTSFVPLAAGAAILVGLLLAGWLARGRWRQRRWLREVHIQPVPAASPDPTVSEPPGASARPPPVRLVPQRDAGSHVLEEVER